MQLGVLSPQLRVHLLKLRVIPLQLRASLLQAHPDPWTVASVEPPSPSTPPEAATTPFLGLAGLLCNTSPWNTYSSMCPDFWSYFSIFIFILWLFKVLFWYRTRIFGLRVSPSLNLRLNLSVTTWFDLSISQTGAILVLNIIFSYFRFF